MQTSPFISMGYCVHRYWQWHHRSMAKQHILPFSAMQRKVIYQGAAVTKHFTGDVQNEDSLW